MLSENRVFSVPSVIDVSRKILVVERQELSASALGRDDVVEMCS